MRELIDTLYFICLDKDKFNIENQKALKCCLKELIRNNLTDNNIKDLIDEIYEKYVGEINNEC